MNFYQRYEMLELIRGDATKIFRAKERATGRSVDVYLFTGTRRPEDDALLDMLRRVPPGSQPQLIEVGDNDGTPYVVVQLKRITPVPACGRYPEAISLHPPGSRPHPFLNRRRLPRPMNPASSPGSSWFRHKRQSAKLRPPRPRTSSRRCSRLHRHRHGPRNTNPPWGPAMQPGSLWCRRSRLPLRHLRRRPMSLRSLPYPLPPPRRPDRNR
ncbi:MAG: hypothetical protein NTY38_28790, partial [Acidobacteria bacterium]|nr:hypothetical protein [Acidobacteriota bacterium]